MLWFLAAVVSLLLAIIGFMYVFETVTEVMEPSLFLKCYVEFISIVSFALFGFSVFAIIKFVLHVVKIFV